MVDNKTTSCLETAARDGGFLEREREREKAEKESKVVEFERERERVSLKSDNTEERVFRYLMRRKEEKWDVVVGLITGNCHQI